MTMSIQELAEALAHEQHMLRILRQRLQDREQQRAHYSTTVPADITSDLHDLSEQIRDHEAANARLEALAGASAPGDDESLPELVEASWMAIKKAGGERVILAASREGHLLVGPNGRVLETNARLHELCGATNAIVGMPVEAFLAAWAQTRAYPAAEWSALRSAIAQAMAGREPSASGELNETLHPVEWTVRPVLDGDDGRSGALLVLREIAAKESTVLSQDLTNMIVHDLRAPLSSVMSAIDLLIRGISGELTDTQQSLLGIAYDSSRQMLEMINTLLDISRLEAGRMPLSLEHCDVRALVEQTVERFAPLAQERNQVIEIDISAELPSVYVDSALIVRVVQNLLVNALKFSGRGSTVFVRAWASGDFVTVTVRDQGIGIAPRDQPRIFAKFGQVGARHSGTGLGLAFCKLAVETHGGRIWVESELDVGSTLFFTLPID
jgi:signal transduction histidine kinase